ncbi:MAG: hypothetical protein ACI9N9_000004 [Enterobacterales bacterium]|jgi:hypothetical protein
MATKVHTLIEQDGHTFNPVALHSVTEEQAHARYCGKAGKYKKGTISAVWKQANGYTVVKPEKVKEPKIEKKEDNAE